MIKTISAVLLISVFAFVATPAASDPMPSNRVFGCSVDPHTPISTPFNDYVVVFGGDVDGQLCQDLINDLQIEGYSFSTITPGSQVPYPGGATGSTPAPTIVHYMVRQRGK